jgi:micrococcal nuclease
VRIPVLIVLLAAACVPAATPTPAPLIPAAATPPLGARQTARVTAVIDGDTIKVSIAGGAAVTLRYIGIDTPETVDPRAGVQCFGKEASAKNADLIATQGAVVDLEKDVSDTDQYGRLLRYVFYNGTETMVNEVLVREGYAKASSYPPDVKYQSRLAAAESRARSEGLGLWSSACGATPPPPPPPDCDPAYPDFCIKAPPPDLDCTQISGKRFRVLSPDPHRLDRDGDGIGCET